MESAKKRICIVEDNREFLEALCMMITYSKGFELVGKYSNAEDAITEIVQLNPDAVLMDINLPGVSGIQCVAKVKATRPEILFLMCTSYEDSDKIFESLQAGASGYILKTEGPAQIMDSLQELIEGGSPMSSSIARKVVASFAKFSPTNPLHEMLSKREIEVLDLLARGLMNKEVGAAIDISMGTVRKHIQHIYEKLHVNTRVEAVNIYLNR
jgi:two-component system, NarL family, response regulator LiaR